MAQPTTGQNSPNVNQSKNTSAASPQIGKDSVEKASTGADHDFERTARKGSQVYETAKGRDEDFGAREGIAEESDVDSDLDESSDDDLEDTENLRA